MKQNKEKDNPVKKSYLAIGIILLVLLIDQVVKFWIKTTFALGEGFDILGFSWAKIHFVENEGMAFGMELGGDYGKLALSLFRLIAVFIIDSVFYGVIFSASTFGQVAEFMPEGGGYTTLLHGHVVDMFYFPMTQGNYPEWMPFLGGKYFMFFRPVFNIADSAITIGVLSILIFQRSIFVNSDAEQKPATESTTPVELQEPVAEEEQPKT